MLLKDAKVLRDKIKAAGWACIVPLGADYRPDKYVARIFGQKPIDFQNEAEWQKHFKMRMAEREKREKWWAENGARVTAWPEGRRDARSPIERMIDEACGFKPGETR